MFVKKKYIITLVLVLLIHWFFEAYNRFTLPQEGIRNPNFVKISRDKKTLFYKENASSNWVALLKITQTNHSIINYLIPWFYAEVFTGVTLTPDKSKLIVTVCNEVETQSDFADEWHFLYDLHNGHLIEIPGNTVIGFSAKHQLVFTSDMNPAMPGETHISVVDLATGEVLLSHEIVRP
jgi:hypothetical protein